MSSYSRQPPSSLCTKKPTDISQHPRGREKFGSKYNPPFEYGSKDKNKIRRLNSQEIDKLPKDTHVRNKASQNPYSKDEDAKEYLQDESLNNDDILPDSFNKI